MLPRLRRRLLCRREKKISMRGLSARPQEKQQPRVHIGGILDSELIQRRTSDSWGEGLSDPGHLFGFRGALQAASCLLPCGRQKLLGLGLPRACSPARGVCQ